MKRIGKWMAVAGGGVLLVFAFWQEFASLPPGMWMVFWLALLIAGWGLLLAMDLGGQS